MTVEELKVEVNRLSPQDKQRFVEEIGLPLCKELMGDPAFMKKICAGTMDGMPEAFRSQMQGMMGPWSRR